MAMSGGAEDAKQPEKHSKGQICERNIEEQKH